MKRRRSIRLSDIVEGLNNFFAIEELDKDPSMSFFVPIVYKDTPHWKTLFESDFTSRYNGLMIRGHEEVHKVFTSCFPHDEILQTFFVQAEPGDFLFLHHPIPMESGNPKGKLGRGFLPIPLTLLERIKERSLSVYACHAPLDYNREISNSRAIVKALQGRIESEIVPYGNGYAGVIAEISPISTEDLIAKLMKLFTIPYVDFAGKNVRRIRKIGVVAGGGDDVEYISTCKEQGVQAYITGEVFSRHQTDWARKNTAKVEEYVKTVGMSLIGVSHAASEFLVMREQMPKWFAKNFSLPAISLPQTMWWM